MPMIPTTGQNSKKSMFVPTKAYWSLLQLQFQSLFVTYIFIRVTLNLSKTLEFNTRIT